MFGKLLCKLKHLEVSNVHTKTLRFSGNSCLKTCGCVKMSCVKIKCSEKNCVAKEFPRTCVPAKFNKLLKKLEITERIFTKMCAKNH